jgi:DNA-binding CsgD family transcriptional regulator
MTISEIGEELDISRNATRAYLSRMKSRNKVVKVADKWGLVAAT